MEKDREKIDLARRVAQEEIDKISGAINPVSRYKLPFAAFALHTMLENMLKYMDERQTVVYESMKDLFGSECHTQRYDRQEAGEEDSESNAFTQDALREKNTKRG